MHEDAVTIIDSVGTILMVSQVRSGRRARGAGVGVQGGVCSVLCLHTSPSSWACGMSWCAPQKSRTMTHMVRSTAQYYEPASPHGIQPHPPKPPLPDRPQNPRRA